MIQKIDKKAVQDAVQMAYDRCKNETGGKNADYIPYLADVPSNLFGIAACLPDGDVVAVTESVVARCQGNYATCEQIAEDVRARTGGKTAGVAFPHCHLPERHCKGF